MARKRHTIPISPSRPIKANGNDADTTLHEGGRNWARKAPINGGQFARTLVIGSAQE